MKIAIIGTGISGLAAAYALNDHHDITVYEKNDYVGGHCRTIELNLNQDTVPVDTGFIVFNKRNYPHLTALFEHLKVPIEKSHMTFGVSIANGHFEYASHKVFAQKRNFFRKKFWRLLLDILRFNKQAVPLLSNDDITLGQYLENLEMGDWFKRFYLQAMGASIWSCPIDTILQYPAKEFVEFFDSHGLLSINDHPQWYTVSGGSQNYVTKIAQRFSEKVRLNCAVETVLKTNEGILVSDSLGGKETYDQVIFACHADQVLNLIQNPDEAQRAAFEKFKYQKNTVVVHSDTSFMPVRRKAWSSWIYLAETMDDHRPQVSLTYWMNRLQNIKNKTSILVTLNPARQPKEHLIHDEHVFYHPVFTLDTLSAQKQVTALQGQNGFWYCGAYMGHGFHEDGIQSSVDIIRKIDGELPWM